MSREDVCAFQYASGPCRVTRGSHGRSPGWTHSFVEPARAEAPQGETCDDKNADGTCNNDYCACDARAAQPETGDGSLADEYNWANRTPAECLELGRIIERRARAAENEACEKLRGYRECLGQCGHESCAAVRLFRKQIAARRGGGR